MKPDICPHCGAEVPRHARACSQCGSDEETGWSDQTVGGDLGLPDEEFDYKDFVKREFGPADPVPRGVGRFWWLVALALVAALIWLWLGWR
jgi:hypothetical protein